MDAAHFAQTFGHVMLTVIDVSGVSALSQITSCALIGELIFAFANISSAEHKQHTKQNSREIQVLL